MIARSLTLPLVAVALALAGCGGGNDVVSGDPAPKPTSTPSPTATATASPAPVSSATPAAGKCIEVTVKPTDPAESTHPESNFYEPDAEKFPSQGDLDHLLLHDNAVVVTYAADTPEKARKRLFDWTYKDVVERTPIVVPDDSPDALPVRAQIATHELRCARLDFKRLTAFVNRTDIAPLPHDG